jgi:hypothetical protein
MESIMEIASFMLAAASCPGLQDLVLLAILALALVQIIIIRNRIKKIENVASVRDFLKHGKRKK